MSSYDDASRIHKKAFLVSNSVLFALCLISSCARLYIRIGLQKSFSVDDGVLVFGVGCLIAAMVLLFIFIDKMYLVEAIESQGKELSDLIRREFFDFQKLVTVGLILTWCSIVSVKFIYLFLFKKLINRLPRMITYWWFVAVLNALISAYGAAVYIAVCPQFYSLKAREYVLCEAQEGFLPWLKLDLAHCAKGEGVQRTIAVSISQMVLDITGDLLILFIPCQLIWKVKVRWTLKVVLSFSLCLIFLTIVCTIIRIAGIYNGRDIKSIDSIWETYWQFITANLALTLTTATAFCRFFISRAQAKRSQSSSSKDRWYEKSKRFFRSAFYPRLWRSKPQAKSPSSGDENQYTSPWRLEQQIPCGTMTGVRTFISGQGKTEGRLSQVMHSMVEGDHEDLCPLRHLSTTEEDKHATEV